MKFGFIIFGLLIPLIVSADVVTEWNEITITTETTAKQLPFEASRTMAIVHTAIFDAVNSIDQQYTPYKTKIDAPAGSSVEAAAITAAYTTLVALFPDQKSSLDSAYNNSLSKISAAVDSKNNGIAVGQKAAAAILAFRQSDGSDAPNVYQPKTTAGVYVPTMLPLGSTWGNVKPWVMQSSSQFRPGPPPDLTSTEWSHDFEESKTLGGKKSTTRTAEQTEIAKCWTLTGPASWDPVVRQLAASPGRSIIQNAHLFALVEIATADAYISVFDAKYTYNFWRPITAIRNAAIDGNDATTAVADWEPLIDTPMHPEYPCAHCITSAAAGVVLENEFGTGTLPVFKMNSPMSKDVVRQWTTIKQYVDEVSAARIYGGIHYRNSTVVGQEMGRKIGQLAIENYMRPGLRGGGARKPGL
jgi:hypothetical protein